MPEKLFTTFIGGELSSKMQNRFDYEKYQSSCKRIMNFNITKEGNLIFRNGTYYNSTISNLENYTNDIIPVAMFEWIRSEYNIFLLIFRYNTTTSKIDLDIYKDFNLIQTIVTDFDIYSLEKLQIDCYNNYCYIIDSYRQPNKLAFDGLTFSLNKVTYDMPCWDMQNLDSITLTASGLTGNITITSSTSFFTERDVGKYIKIIKSDDNSFGYVVITGYTSETSITATTKQNLTTTSSNIFQMSLTPSAVLFYQGRLWYGSENKIVASRTQDGNGLPRFDDFTVGSNAEDGINLTSSMFKTPILWIRPVNNTLFCGTITNIFKISNDSDPILTPSNLPNITPISNEGSNKVIPLQEQNNIFYISNVGVLNETGSRVNAIKYDFYSSDYQIINLNLFNDEINREGICKTCYVKGYEDYLYCLKNNGELSVLIYNPEQSILSWFRVVIGGGWDRTKGKNSDCVIEDIQKLSQPNGGELLVLIVKRKQGNDFVRTIEYLSQPNYIVDESDYYTGDKEFDEKQYKYFLYQSQLNQNYLDCASVYNGYQEKPATLSKNEIGEATFYCATYSFTSSDIGKSIKEYFDYDLIDGEALIIDIIDEHTIKLNIESLFSSLTLTRWILTTDTINLPDIYKNKTIQTIVDGGIGQSYEIGNDGILKLQAQSSFVIVGFKYLGLVKTLNLNSLSQSGSTASYKKQINSFNVCFLNTMSVKTGTNLYNLDVLYNGPSELIGKPPLLMNGVYTFKTGDEPSKEKELYFLKDDYSSCNIQYLSIDINYNK